jgi:hypothetical protein
MKTSIWLKVFGVLLTLTLLPGLSGTLVTNLQAEIPSASADVETETASGFSGWNSTLPRVERPLQFQLMLTNGGGFGTTTRNPGAAVHAGYQLSKSLYAGFTSQYFYNAGSPRNWRDDKSYNDRKTFGQEAVIETVQTVDPRYLLELRVFPWSFGAYFSTGVMQVGRVESVTRFQQTERVINQTEYKAGPVVTLDYETWTGASIGTGFNQVFNNGFSLVTALNVGLGVQSPEVTIASDVPIAEADIEDWRERIEYNEQRVPFMFLIGIGYAF